MDLNLPDIDGLKVIAKIREDSRTACIPVNILAGSNAGRDRKKSYEAGANSYLKKPVSYGALETLLHGVMDYWFKVALLPPR